MSFLTPVFLTLALLALPIIALYMLRLRRRPVTISSTLLWQRLMRDREANAPWQRLRRNLLLILQLIILALLVLALARPFLRVDRLVNGNLVVLLDGSASMLVREGEMTRFGQAQAEVRRLAGQLAGNNQMTLILVGSTPEMLLAASTDRAALRSAVDESAARPARADWAAAFAMAAGAAQGYREAEIVIVSDGGLPPDLPPLPFDVTYLPVGNATENSAITALAARTVTRRDAPEVVELFAAVTNYGTVAQEALVTLERDGVFEDARRVDLAAGETAELIWRLPATTAVVTARLEPSAADGTSADALAQDNVAWTVTAPGSARRVLLVSAGNLFLEQVLRILPGVTATRVDPAEAPSRLADADAPDWDLIVYDGVPVPEATAAPTLLVDPQPGAAWLPVGSVYSDTVATRIADDALLAFVDWTRINIREAQAVQPAWGQTLVASAAGHPLLHIGEQNERRVAVLAFDLRDSDLPLQVSFPILIANLTAWLDPGRVVEGADAITPGDDVFLAAGPLTEAVVVNQPDGSEWRRDAADATVVFRATQIGVHEVRHVDGSGERLAGYFAVNLFTPTESQIAPSDTIRVGRVPVGDEPSAEAGRQEVWPWLVGVALAVLAAEWWVFFRGVPLWLRRGDFVGGQR